MLLDDINNIVLREHRIYSFCIISMSGGENRTFLVFGYDGTKSYIDIMYTKDIDTIIITSFHKTSVKRSDSDILKIIMYYIRL